MAKAYTSVRTALPAVNVNVTTADAKRWWDRASAAVASAARSVEASTAAIARDLSAGMSAATATTTTAATTGGHAEEERDGAEG